MSNTKIAMLKSSISSSLSVPSADKGLSNFHKTGSEMEAECRLYLKIKIPSAFLFLGYRGLSFKTKVNGNIKGYTCNT